MSRRADDDVSTSPEADLRDQSLLEAKPKTSAAATFALVFGLSGLFCVLAVLLVPLGLVFAVIGLILGIIGMKKARQPHITGRGLAIGGLAMSVLALLLGVAVTAGVATFLGDPQNRQQIEDQLGEVRSEIPTEVPT